MKYNSSNHMKGCYSDVPSLMAMCVLNISFNWNDIPMYLLNILNLWNELWEFGIHSKKFPLLHIFIHFIAFKLTIKYILLFEKIIYRPLCVALFITSECPLLCSLCWPGIPMFMFYNYKIYNGYILELDLICCLKFTIIIIYEIQGIILLFNISVCLCMNRF